MIAGMIKRIFYPQLLDAMRNNLAVGLAQTQTVGD